jgi:hypothetical protein
MITYFTSFPKSGVQLSASQIEYIDQVSSELHQQKLPKLKVNNLTLVWKVLGNPFHELTAKLPITLTSSQVFQALWEFQIFLVSQRLPQDVHIQSGRYSTCLQL